VVNANPMNSLLANGVTLSMCDLASGLLDKGKDKALFMQEREVILFADDSLYRSARLR
jgi:hypothetical protein